MASDLLSKMTLTKWIITAVVVAAAVLFALFNFTSFQIPKSFTEGPREPQVGGGITVQGSTQACTNLDHVHNKIHDKAECTNEGEGSGNDQ